MEARCSGMELRDYQTDFVEAALPLLADGKHVLLQCPTGSGKTEMAADVIQRVLTEQSVVVWLTHRVELRRQLATRFKAQAIAVRDLSALPREERVLTPGAVNIVSPAMGGVMTIPEACTPEDLLIVDEAHHAPAATWERLILAFPGAVLGLTATPWRLSPHEGFERHFQHLLSGLSTLDLVRAGWLAPPRVEVAALVKGGAEQAGEYVPSDVDVRAGGLSGTRRPRWPPSDWRARFGAPAWRRPCCTRRARAGRARTRCGTSRRGACSTW